MNTYADGRSVFHLMRHGATEHNLRGLRCGGDLDIELADVGRQQIKQAAAQVRVMQPQIGLIVSSALLRARETASIMSEALHGIPVVIEPLLNERRLGEWNQQPIEATEALLRRYATPPGGEPEHVFVQRIGKALEALMPRLSNQLLVVGSSGVGRVFHTLLGGEGRLRMSNGEIVRFIVERNKFALTIPNALPKHD